MGRTAKKRITMGLNKKTRKDTKKVEVYLVVAVPIEGFTSMAAST